MGFWLSRQGHPRPAPSRTLFVACSSPAQAQLETQAGTGQVPALPQNSGWGLRTGLA